MLRPSSGRQVLGVIFICHDGMDKVTGAPKYGAEIQSANMLRGKVVRNSYTLVRICNIDTDRVEAARASQPFGKLRRSPSLGSST